MKSIEAGEGKMKKKEKNQQAVQSNQRAEMSEEFWYGDNDPGSQRATDAVDETGEAKETE